MFYVAAATAAAGSISNLLQAKDSGKLAQKQAELALQRLAKVREQQQLASVQDARNTSASLFNLQVQSQNAEAGIKLQAAASDTVGASVQDALSTVQVVTGRQEAQVERDYVIGEEERYRSFINEAQATGQEVDALYRGAINQQRSAALGLVGSVASAVGSEVASDVGKNYADNRLKGQGFSTALSNAFSSYLK